MAVFFTPGKGIDFSQTAADTVQAQEISPSETLINFIPTNIFDALSKGSIIQIIVFAPVFGIALNRFCKKNPQSQLLTIIVDLNEVVLTIIRYVMILAPIGIFFCADCFNDQFFGVTDHFTLGKYLLIYGLATLTFLALWIVA